MSGKRAIAATAALMVIGGLAGCSSAGSQAAQEAYDQCVKEDAEVQLLRLSKNTVSIEVKGDDARAYAGTSDEIENLGSPDSSLSGLGVSFAFLTGAECLADVTNYPGSAEQLTDGEEWDGWRYSEEDGAGSEFSLSFISTR